VTTDEVCIGNWIFWTLTLVTKNNYDSLTVTTAHKVFSIVTSRCLVAAFNGGRSPSSGFPNCPRLQLPASHFSQLQLTPDSTSNQLVDCKIAAGHRQDSDSWFRVPRDSWPYYTPTNKWITSPRHIAPDRFAQETCLPLLRVLSLPGKHRVRRAVP
jgi:hypothetical protein